MVGRRGPALAAALLVLAAGAAGCGGGGDGGDSSAAKRRDLDILTRALQREHKLIAAAAAAGAELDGRDAKLGGELLGSSETHTANLTRAIRKLGGTPHQPRKDYSDQVAGKRSRRALVALVADLGTRVAAADTRAAERISDEDYRGLTQAVGVSNRHHADALRRALAGS